ncbi:MAG: permease [Bacillota bacterium]
MFEAILYILAAVLLILSFIKDRAKTKQALLKALHSFWNLFPVMAGILALMGLALTLLNPDLIARLIGGGSGFVGMISASIIGAITLIPAFIAFPLAASLLVQGAGIMQIAVFVSTLMMVGIITAPLEIKYFGRKATLLRNLFSYLFSFVVALVIGVILL